SETRGLLSTLFSLTAIWYYVRRVDRPERSVRYLSLATAAFVLAVLAKPSAVALPLVVAATDWGFLQSTHHAPRDAYRRYLLLLVWSLIALAIAAINKSLQA